MPSRSSRRSRASLGAGRLRILLRRMPCGHVADLMSEHAGQLRFVAKKRQQAAGDVDVPAGQRKRVDRRNVDDRELPGQVRPLGQARQPQADVRDICLQRAIVVDAHLFPDFGILLLAD